MPERVPSPRPSAAGSGFTEAYAALARWGRSLVPAPPGHLEPPSVRLRTAVVAVDGTPASDMALATLIAWGAREGTTLHLASVMEPIPRPWDSHAGSHLDLETDLQRTIREVLRTRADTIEDSGLPHEDHLLSGHPATVIVGLARDLNADLIAMGSSSRHGLDRILLGSVSAEVQAHATVPVLITKDERAKAPRRILVAVDGSERSLHAAAWALFLADELGAEVTVAHVAEGPRHRPKEETLTFDEWTDRVRDTFPPVVVGGSPVRLELRAGDPRDLVLDLARSGAYDLVCLGARGLTAPMALLLGSVSRKVSHEAPCSILIAR